MTSSRYIISRTLQAIFTVLAVITFTFIMIRWMPGGPEDYFMAKMMNTDIDSDQLAVMMEAYTNLKPNEPLHIQYIDYMVSILQGDLGISIWYQDPVTTIIGRAMPWTIFLSAVSLILIFSIGIAFGAVMAYKEGSRFDVTSSVCWIIIESVPYYVFAVVMLWVLAYTNDIFPIGGQMGADVYPGFNLEFILSVIHHSTLPILSLVITGIGGIALGMRGNSIRVLGEDYLRVARLRGLPEGQISMRYVGRNAILPMYTSMMISIGSLFGGSVILETLFNYPGIGYYMFEAVSARDYPLMMGTFLFITVGVVVGVYIADLTYGFIDPRAGSAANRESFGGLSLSSVGAFFRKGKWLVNRITNQSLRSNTAAAEPAMRGGSTVTTDDTTTESIDSPFSKVSDVTLSKQERFVSGVDENLLAPLRVIMKDWRALIGSLIIAFFLGLGAIAWISSSDFWLLENVTIVAEPRALEGPVLLQPFKDPEFLLGTSDMGQGLLAQLIHATPAMLKMMAGGAVFATGMAVFWGLLSGYLGGAIDRWMMVIADILMTIPGLPLVIVIATLLEPRDPFVVGVILTINGWAGFSRALRSQVLTIRQESYVEASRTMNLSTGRIISKDVLPNLMPLVMVNFVTSARRVIVASVSLYFLGILPFTTLNWGVMLNMAYSSGTWYNLDAAHWFLTPILTIVVLSLGLILFGQGCDRIFNPRIRARHTKTSSDGSEDASIA